MKDHFSVLLTLHQISQHMYTPSTLLAFICTACIKIIVHVKDPMFTFDQAVIVQKKFILVWHRLETMVKVVYRNQSDSHCNQSDTQPSILVTTARALLVTTLLPSLTRTHHITLSVLEGWWWGGGGPK